MMSPGKPDQAAPRGGAERPQEQRTAAGADDKAQQQGAGPQGGYGQQGGYGPQGWGGGPGGYGMPPWWGMPPGMPGMSGMSGMSGPYGMPGYGMPPGGPQGGPPAWPWSWMSLFMPWLGPWWSWLSSWFVWPGASWMLPPFSPFSPFPPFLPPAPFPGGPVGAADPTLRFAETRAAFWRHTLEAQADIFRQAANACYVPGVVPTPPAAQVDIAQLKEALKTLPEPQAALVIHAVQLLQAWDGVRPQQRAGADW